MGMDFEVQFQTPIHTNRVANTHTNTHYTHGQGRQHSGLHDSMKSGRLLPALTRGGGAHCSWVTTKRIRLDYSAVDGDADTGMLSSGDGELLVRRFDLLNSTQHLK